MSLTDAFTRVHMLHGKTIHLVLADTALSGSPRALCRARPYLGRSWFGTGDQLEYEKAAALPVCGKCQAVAEQRAEGGAAT
jgi:hypothetical protein